GWISQASNLRNPSPLMPLLKRKESSGETVIKQAETMFAEEALTSSNIVSFFAKNSPDFHKWPYETFFIIL
ncbi:hypothetical protein, partial [Megasphaera sp.]|uniref:hypothetical protein n=1 Tax=Megasphaera sp. TaxID=2023260 RepID=UPI003F7E46B8